MSILKILGYILSKASSRQAFFQPLKEAEGDIKEGMFIIIRSENGDYLSEIMNITHYNEYYEIGEVWTEALREGHKPPYEIARKFTVVSLKILGILKGQKLISADKPPHPGDPVYPASGKELKCIYKFDPSSEEMPPAYIKIGTIYGYEKEDVRLPAILNAKAINMHFTVIGITGSGKSNTVGKIIEELGKINNIYGKYKTIPTMIIDANGDYIDYFSNPELVESYDNIFRFYFKDSQVYYERRTPSSKSELKEIRLDINVFTPDEIAETIMIFHRRGKLEGAELQINYLSTLLSEKERLKEQVPSCIIDDELDYNCILNNIDILEGLIDSDVKSKRVHESTAKAIKRALRLFHERIVNKYRLIPKYRDGATLNDEFIDEITNPISPKMAIIDFSTEGATGVHLDIKQYVVYNILALLFRKFTNYKVKNDERLLLFIIEESQNYAPNLQVYPIGFSVARNMLASIATQGRKFGLCLGLVTQRPSFVDPIVMSMMNTYIIHRIAPGD
ncbi:MAG TPA: ATP-binding protein, partial [Thermoprotei archaeon]|nr:ATP-binding protein [Thermoprotei archaeon]